MKTYGMILAGGKGSRLGPLAAQISKALVSVGSRPQVINQIELLKQSDAEKIVVVVSPSTRDQVKAVIDRAGFDDIEFGVQHVPNGPALAINHGGSQEWEPEDEVIILMSDTVLELQTLPTGEWVGVASTENRLKSWCWQTREGHYVDMPLKGHASMVTIGAYRFNVGRLRDAISELPLHLDGEIGMASLLNQMQDIRPTIFTDWQDVGDVLSLADAKRDRFISRASHRLQLTPEGLIVKAGVSKAEIEFFKDIAIEGDETIAMFPRVYAWGKDWYKMEYVDNPSLAELWLYWPGPAEMWGNIVTRIVNKCSRALWSHTGTATIEDMYDFLVKKAEWRLRQVDVQPDMVLLDRLCGIIGRDVWVRGHGDLNFTNIFFSLNTGAIKLIDPRGGDVPLIYEYAKLAYSPEFAAITHGLVREHSILPKREAESTAVWNAVVDYVSAERLYACMALIAFAALPLHDESQRAALLACAYDWSDRAQSNSA